MPTELQKKRDELKEKNEKLVEVFKQAGSDMDMAKVECLGSEVKSTRDKAQKIDKMNKELTDIGKEVDELVVVEKTAMATKDREALLNTPVKGIVHPSGGNDGSYFGKGGIVEPKSIGQMFIESKAWTGKNQKEVAELDIHLKTLFETTAGWAPEVTRTGKLVLDAQRPIQVVDVIPSGNTTQNSIAYMEETTFTNAAQETAEAGTYQESTLVYAEQTSAIRKIAVFIPVTDEQLEDEARISSLLDNRLRFMIQQRLDLQILVGDGSAPNLKGINNVAGIQTQAKGADPVPDAIYKAMTKIRVTGQAQPNATIINPLDWQDIRLLRTSDGVYIWGSPSETGPERMWGIQIVQAQAQTENTALVGDYANFCELVTRKGIEVQISDSHSDFFIKGKKAIRAQMRVGLPVYRPAAFCTVTGI